MTLERGRTWTFPGAGWWKFDFHTHTPCSSDTYWHRKQDTPDHLSPEQWLQRFMDAGIDCVAITDHNSGAWIDDLKAAYEEMRNVGRRGFRELHLFPGVEISVNGGFHLLAILDVTKSTSDIDTVLGAAGFLGTKGDSDDVTQKSAVDVIDAIVNAGGIPIPAHADREKGLFQCRDGSRGTVLDPNTVRQVLKRTEILAMETVDRCARKPDLYFQSGKTWTEVAGSDCHTFRDGHAPGSRYTWVKMETPNLEGLRLALMDGAKFSIRNQHDPDPTELPDFFVESVELKNARYMGRGSPAIANFSPRLNAILGGRGTGKSTIVHALRLASRRENELLRLDGRSDPRMTFDRFNRVPDRERSRDTGGLMSRTTITWTVRKDDVRHRVHWSAEDTGDVVEEWSAGNQWRRSSIQAITPARFPIRIFSQGQIAALAGEDQRALLQVVDDAAGAAELHRQLEEAKAAFRVARSRIRELNRKLERRNGCRVEREDVERKLRRFEDAGNAAILTNFRRRSRQHDEVERQFTVAENAVRDVDAAGDALLPEDLPAKLFDEGAEEDRQAVAVITKLGGAIRAATSEMRHTAQRLKQAVEARRADMAGSSWPPAVEQARQAYGEWVENLNAAGISEPAEYGRLVQDRQRLDGELAHLDSMLDDRKRASDDADACQRRIRQARHALTDSREKFLVQALTDNEYVSIKVRAYGSRDDLRAVERSLREALDIVDDRFREDILTMEDQRRPKGAVAMLFADLPADHGERRSEIDSRIARLKERIQRACDGSCEFGGHFNKYLVREVGRTPELLDRILAWFPDDGLDVRYSRSGDGDDFRPIGQASAGQRSAAMLAFLLAHGSEPLVLDQPEDDLDNQLIYDLIVSQIREQKLKRQIIIVTHNANVVVNGDAEMLYVLDFRNQCFIRHRGSLQQDAMREEVCRVMEGGREAFNLRYRRLDPEQADVR